MYYFNFPYWKSDLDFFSLKQKILSNYYTYPIMETANKKLSELISLSGKCAIITGGAQGLGAAIAHRFAQAGASVMIIDLNEEKSQHVVSAILSSGGKAACHRADITQLEEIQLSIQKTLSTFGRIDILVNNAGIYPPTPGEISPEVWNRIMSLNLNSVFYFSQETARWMKENSVPGSIINISSIAGIKGVKESIPYSTSKAAVLMMTKSMALELAPYHIRVNAIAPGAIQTEGLVEMMKLMDTMKTEVSVADYLGKLPLKRMAHPDEIARPALFLASELASYMTGSTIVCDGGFLLS